MASIKIRNLEDWPKSRLRVQVAFHGRQGGVILQSVINCESTRPGNLAASIRACFRRLGGIKLSVVPREPMRKLPSFGP